MNCPKCNNKIKMGNNFCTECGTKIESDSNITLTVTREKRILGFAISFPVFVDDEKIGDLKNDSSLVCNLTTGIHKVTIKSFEKTIDKEIEVNEETKGVEIIVNLKMGILAGRANVKEIIYK